MRAARASVAPEGIPGDQDVRDEGHVLPAVFGFMHLGVWLMVEDRLAYTRRGDVAAAAQRLHTLVSYRHWGTPVSCHWGAVPYVIGMWCLLCHWGVVPYI